MKRITLLGVVMLLCATAQEQPAFVLADVHSSATAPGFAQNFGGVLRGGKYVNRDATMLQLIAGAYGLSEDNIGGGPGWVSSDLFDVIAKVPEGTKMAAANLMLQKLLADRFQLVIAHETRPVPRYVMSVAKGGSKLKPASGSGEPGCRPKPGQGGGPGPGGDLASLPNIQVECRDLTAAAIADNLHQMAGGYLDHDVVDSTKLDGSFDFDIEWTARGALAAKGTDGISIFNAAEKQLGLKLELKDVPMPSLSIASVNRTPSPNAPGVATELAEAPPRFEAASIKPADPDDRMMGLLYTGGSQMKAGGTLRALIAMSLQITPNIANDMVVGLPKSADTTRWSIIAKVPSTGEGAPNVAKGGRPLPPPLSVGLQMLYGLVLDRFELKTHTENREVTVYALTMANGKPKMAQANVSERAGCNPDNSAPKPAPTVSLMLRCKNTSMGELARNLAQWANAYIDHPIVDGTGLEGGWDFLIGWTPRGMPQRQTENSNSNQGPGGMAAASDPSGGLSVFDAVEKELGLKLVKQTKSIPVIVVDHVDEKPIEN